MPAGAVSSSREVLRRPCVENRRVAVSSSCSVIRARSASENAGGILSPYEQIGFLFIVAPRETERGHGAGSAGPAVADHRSEQALDRLEGGHAQAFDDSDGRGVAFVHLG